MKKGIVFGCWDMFHVGHLRCLNIASRACDYLTVGVAGDDAVAKDKGSHPVICEMQRRDIVRSIKGVSDAVIYTKLDFLPLLMGVRPDIMFVSTTWGRKKRHSDAEDWCSKNGCDIVVIAYSKDISTTEIKRRAMGP